MRQPSAWAAWLCASASVLLGMAVSLPAQFTPPPPAKSPFAPPAAGGGMAALAGQPLRLPPLLYLRLAGPKGMKVTLYRGADPGIDFDAPAVIGVRPGYCYRLALSNIDGFPGAVFYPTLDVHGSLWLISQLNNADFPATILFSHDDFAKAEDGVLIRKAIVLERPDDAVPIASRSDRPIELAAVTGRHLLQEASRYGAPLAVLNLGQRKFTADEMRDAAVPGTLLFPGEKTLPAPRVGPCLPWGVHPVHDPRNGPPHLGEWTTLHDGGDINIPVGYGMGGKLAGLDPTDTVAEYVDPVGRKRIVPSNRVHLCVPRFILLRSEQTIGSNMLVLGPGHTQALRQGIVFIGRQGLLEQMQPIGPESTVGRLKPGATVNEQGTAVTGLVNGAEVVATLRMVDTLDGTCPRPALVAPERPLRIIKWPLCAGANVGDIVTFYLRYTNLGSEPVTAVAVTDNLTTRFEYVAGSQQTDRAAGFTVEPNEAGSSILRWEFPGSLAPGASGTISFQVRVR